MIFLAAVPADLARYYPTAYYSVPESKEKLEAVARKEQFKLDLIQPHRSGAKLLEIGSAWGSFAYAAKSVGYDVAAVEMDERCRKYLREVVGVAVYEPDERGGLPEGLGHYDIVALWHVIEHVPRFDHMLTEIAELVRVGGIVAIASPNPDAWQFGVMRRRWAHVDAPRHLQLIPPQVIIEVLARSNFRVTLATSTDAGGLRWNRFGWQRLLINALPQSRATMAVGLGVGAAIAEIVRPLDRRQLRGATYTLILRKEPA